jgi:hypothetical protein
MDARRWRMAALLGGAVLVALGPFCIVWYFRTHDSIKPAASPGGDYVAEIVTSGQGTRLVVTRKKDGVAMAMAPARLAKGEEGTIVWTKDGGACGLLTTKRRHFACIVRVSAEYVELADEEVLKRLNEAAPAALERAKGDPSRVPETEEPGD